MKIQDYNKIQNYLIQNYTFIVLFQLERIKTKKRNNSTSES